MMEREPLVNFKKMWAWLSGYPAHDREYYMKNVARLDEPWTRACPLANSPHDDCDGCRLLWHSGKGTLCTDPNSPLYKWKYTGRDLPDNRSFYASHIAVLAMNGLRTIDKESAHPGASPADFIDSQLHG